MENYLGVWSQYHWFNRETFETDETNHFWVALKDQWVGTGFGSEMASDPFFLSGGNHMAEEGIDRLWGTLGAIPDLGPVIVRFKLVQNDNSLNSGEPESEIRDGGKLATAASDTKERQPKQSDAGELLSVAMHLKNYWLEMNSGQKTLRIAG